MSGEFRSAHFLDRKRKFRRSRWRRDRVHLTFPDFSRARTRLSANPGGAHICSCRLRKTGGDRKNKFAFGPYQAPTAGAGREGKMSISDRRRRTKSSPIEAVAGNGLLDRRALLERLMPANGYPMRLLLPGYEGNMNIKYLRRIKLVERPAMSVWEARTYAPI